MVSIKERFNPSGLPYDHTAWADAAWVQGYERLWDEMRVCDDPMQTDRLLRHLKNTEFDWLQQLMYRYHDGLDMHELMDKRALKQRLNIEQGKHPDYHAEAL